MALHPDQPLRVVAFGGGTGLSALLRALKSEAGRVRVFVLSDLEHDPDPRRPAPVWSTPFPAGTRMLFLLGTSGGAAQRALIDRWIPIFDAHGVAVSAGDFFQKNQNPQKKMDDLFRAR